MLGLGLVLDLVSQVRCVLDPMCPWFELSVLLRLHKNRPAQTQSAFYHKKVTMQIDTRKSCHHLTYSVIVIQVQLFANDKRQQIIHSSVIRVRCANESNPERRSIRSVWWRTRRSRIFRQFHQTIYAFARSKVSPDVICNV